MPTRHRERSEMIGHIGSFYHHLITPHEGLYGPVMQGWSEECDDTNGNMGEVNPLSISFREIHYPYFNGSRAGEDGTIFVRCVDLPPISMSPGAYDPWTEYGPLSTTANVNDMAIQILARVNPNVAHVSVPTFVAELKDFPSLVRDWGGDLLKKVAKGNLSWRWALKPMISDVTKLLTFQQAVQQRIDWLTKLRDGKELKRRCGLSESERYDPWLGPYPIESNIVWVTASSRTRYSEKTWGTATFVVDPGVSLPTSKASLYSQALRLTLGITSYEALATAWELIPWSWLVDWFYPVGDTIAALNNTIPLVTRHLSCMRTTTSTREWRIHEKPSWLSISGQTGGKWVRKERIPCVLILPFSPSIPLVTKGKWSVLASLAALKRK